MRDKSFDMLEDAAAEADRWGTDVGKALGQENSSRGRDALRAVLLALRDFLPFEDAVALGNRLPALVRGEYYEGWKPAASSTPASEDFLARISARLDGVEPKTAAAAVCRLFTKESAEWPEALKSFCDQDVATAEPPKDINKKVIEIKVAMDRAEMDGMPQEELPAMLENLRDAQKAPDRVDLAIEDLEPWLQPLIQLSGWGDRARAFGAVRAVIQSLRNRLPRHEALRLGTRLPSTLRGYYFEDWDPELSPSLERPLEDFRSDVAERLAGVFDIAPDEAAVPVLRVLGAVSDVPIPNLMRPSRLGRRPARRTARTQPRARRRPAAME